MTVCDIEEFQELSKIPHKSITSEQEKRFDQLFEQAYGKSKPLTKLELEDKIKSKPLNEISVEECFPKISQVSVGDYVCSSTYWDFSKYPQNA